MPKLVPKSKPVDVDDKKTGTGDKTTPQLPNDTSFQTNSSSNNKKIKFDNSKSKADISKLKKKITDEKKETLNKLKEFNDKISQRKEEILKLTNENNVLLKELNRNKNEVDDKVKYKRVYKYKDDQIEKEANQINKDIEIFEKELKNTKKMTLLGYAKEKEYLEKFLNQNDENVLNQMKEEVNYHKEILEINKNKYNELKKNTATHNSCKNKIKQLKQRLIDLQNQLNYENKFSDKIKLELSKDDEEDNDMYLEEESIDERFQKRNKYRNKKNIETKLMKRGLSNPILNNRKLRIPDSEKFQDAKEVQKSRQLYKKILPIWEELEKVNEKYIKSMNEKSSKYTYLEENPLPNCLFTNNEIKVLCKLIPEENLENFSERFFKLERERQEMEDLYYSNQDKKKELEENKTKIDHSALKMKELNKAAILIKGELTKIKKLIKDRKQVLKMQGTKLKEVNYLYNIKNRENIQLKQHLSFLNEKIKNGELVIQQQFKEEEEKKNINNNYEESENDDLEKVKKEENEENEEDEGEENDNENNNKNDNENNNENESQKSNNDNGIENYNDNDNENGTEIHNEDNDNNDNNEKSENNENIDENNNNHNNDDEEEDDEQ